MKTDADWDQFVSDAIEQAVGFYYEKTKDDIDKVIEALGAAKVNLDKIPKIEKDVIELKASMKTVKLALKGTNQDVRKLTVRVSALEAAA